MPTISPIIPLSVWHGAHAICPRRVRYALARRRKLCVTPHGASESATSLFNPFTNPIQSNTPDITILVFTDTILGCTEATLEPAEGGSCLATGIITKRAIDLRPGQVSASDGPFDSLPTSWI